MATRRTPRVPACSRRQQRIGRALLDDEYVLERDFDQVKVFSKQLIDRLGQL